MLEKGDIEKAIDGMNKKLSAEGEGLTLPPPALGPAPADFVDILCCQCGKETIRIYSRADTVTKDLRMICKKCGSLLFDFLNFSEF